MGLWLWQSGDTPRKRDVFIRLDGPGAAQVRSLEAQLPSPEGEVTQRLQRFFQDRPPPEVRLEARLTQERQPVLLFLKDAQGRGFPVQRLVLEVTEADAATLPVHVPAPMPSGR